MRLYHQGQEAVCGLIFFKDIFYTFEWITMSSMVVFVVFTIDGTWGGEENMDENWVFSGSALSVSDVNNRCPDLIELMPDFQSVLCFLIILIIIPGTNTNEKI